MDNVNPPMSLDRSCALLAIVAESTGLARLNLAYDVEHADTNAVEFVSDHQDFLMRDMIRQPAVIFTFFTFSAAPHPDSVT